MSMILTMVAFQAWVYKNMEAILVTSKQTEIKDIHNYEIVSPVEEVEEEEDAGEEVHGDPVDLLIGHLDLLPDTATVPLVVVPLPVHLMLALPLPRPPVTFQGFRLK